MALLKSLIQRLLDSRTTPEEAGHSAMPSPTEVSLTPSVTSQEVWGDVCTGIASSDGYIRMNFGATSPEAIGSARSFGAVAFSTPQVTGDIVSVICPVAKGRAYAMSARNANNITCAFVKLIGSIGGGQTLKNVLLQGGAICLNSLSSSLRRSSLLVRRSGSATSLRPSYQGARKSPLSLAPILKTTQRRATELYVSILLTLRGQSSALLLISGRSYCTARTKQEFIKRLRFLSQRVKRSTLISQRIKATLVSSSFRPSVLNEVKGGASC